MCVDWSLRKLFIRGVSWQYCPQLLTPLQDVLCELVALETDVIQLSIRIYESLGAARVVEGLGLEVGVDVSGPDSLFRSFSLN